MMLLCHIQIRTFEYKTFRMKSIYLKRSHQVLLTSHPTNPQLSIQCVAKYLEIRATTMLSFLSFTVLFVEQLLLALSYMFMLCTRLYSVCQQPHQYVQNCFHFAHLKLKFSILQIYFYKTSTLVCLLQTFIQIKYSFLNTVTMRRERKEKRERRREERKKRIKKSFTR